MSAQNVNLFTAKTGYGLETFNVLVTMQKHMTLGRVTLINIYISQRNKHPHTPLALT